ncbi:hypothetical protein PW5551_10165 [Petrotoga sp. 9PW.55.5.1]|uniref:ABC transporter ATP-binding protein n=1 Tax=Petrotoga sp. 9PW.55.5.1 TaxID=1308979 RepID=UPI000DC273CC|nr:ABC transporter ATP-binding protein [Petrotoga sp. 9PW.55.5.1]RAO98384.1 hypothetical protein PW5551_10165 [Petrotoga sp. 9PW.55.5.1]
MPVLEVQNLYKRYRNGKVANRNINLSMDNSELLLLMGPNGAGKTTLVRQISGLITITSGFIKVCGIDVSKNPKRIKEMIAYKPQTLSGLSELTFYEALLFFGQLRKFEKSLLANRIEEIVNSLKLSKIVDVRVDRLSGGYRQLLAVALALLPETPLIVLDEPSAGLDPEHRYLVWNQIHKLQKKGCSILITSHNLEELESHIDRFAIIVDGEIVKEGYLQEFIEKSSTKRGFSIQVRPLYGKENEVRKIFNQWDFFVENDGQDRWITAKIDTSKNLNLEKCILELSSITKKIEIKSGSLEEYYIEAVQESEKHED